MVQKKKILAYHVCGETSIQTLFSSEIYEQIKQRRFLSHAILDSGKSPLRRFVSGQCDDRSRIFSLTVTVACCKLEQFFS